MEWPAFRAVVVDPLAAGGGSWGRARCFDGPPSPIRRVLPHPAHVTLAEAQRGDRRFACLPWKGYR
jgi:hypothetical protein